MKDSLEIVPNSSRMIVHQKFKNTKKMKFPSLKLQTTRYSLCKVIDIYKSEYFLFVDNL